MCYTKRPGDALNGLPYLRTVVVQCKNNNILIEHFSAENRLIFVVEWQCLVDVWVGMDLCQSEITVFGLQEMRLHKLMTAIDNDSQGNLMSATILSSSWNNGLIE